jgi:hypothetical protein
MIVERYQLTACAGAKAPFNNGSRCRELGRRTEAWFEVSSLLVLRV